MWFTQRNSPVPPPVSISQLGMFAKVYMKDAMKEKVESNPDLCP